MSALRTVLVPAGALLMWSAAGSAHAQTPVPANTPAAKAGIQTLPERRPGGTHPADKVMLDALELVEREYFDEGVTREELVEAALHGVVDYLNRRAARQGHPPVNAVLSRREMSRLADSMSGRVVGIGVYAKPGAKGIDVLHVFDDSPAGKAGVRKGDRIVAVDDRAVAPLLSTIGVLPLDLLRGEEGTTVKLTLLREAETAHETQVDVKLTRRSYAVSPVVSRILENDLGYLKIASFTRGAADEVASTLLTFRRERVWGVIVDVRGNPGGSLEEATAIAAMFVDPGKPLVQIRGRGEPQTVFANREVLWPAPMPVSILVDSGTASAAEALASALQTSERALLVGERTAGRGLGESIFALPTGGALRLATARYASAMGESWIQRGLVPDSTVLALSLEPDDDPPLRAAVTIMGRFRQSLAPAQTPMADPLVAPVTVHR